MKLVRALGSDVISHLLGERTLSRVQSEKQDDARALGAVADHGLQEVEGVRPEGRRRRARFPEEGALGRP